MLARCWPTRIRHRIRVARATLGRVRTSRRARAPARDHRALAVRALSREGDPLVAASRRSRTHRSTSDHGPQSKRISDTGPMIGCAQMVEEGLLAIVGIGCRFPGGASDASSFWSLLVEGRDGIIPVPDDRWDLDRHYSPNPKRTAKAYVRQAGFLREPIDAFDASFFRLSPREAAGLDPQQRLLLEASYEALEDAGIPLQHAARERTGVFVGGFCLDNQLVRMASENRDLVGIYTAMSSTMTMLSNRVSYSFDLRGPATSRWTPLRARRRSSPYTWPAAASAEPANAGVALVGGVNVMAEARDDDGVVQGPIPRARRTLQGVRCPRRRVRTRRRGRRRRGEAVRASARRRRPYLRRHPRDRHQSRRADRRDHGAERARKPRSSRRCAGAAAYAPRGRPVRRSTRHGDRSRRSHRGVGDRRGVGTRSRAARTASSWGSVQSQTSDTPRGRGEGIAKASSRSCVGSPITAASRRP